MFDPPWSFLPRHNSGLAGLGCFACVEGEDEQPCCPKHSSSTKRGFALQTKNFCLLGTTQGILHVQTSALSWTGQNFQSDHDSNILRNVWHADSEAYKTLHQSPETMFGLAFFNIFCFFWRMRQVHVFMNLMIYILPGFRISKFHFLESPWQI